MQVGHDGEHLRRPSLEFSDIGEDNDAEDTHPGDYSTRMGELFDDEDEDRPAAHANGYSVSDDDDDEPFVYNGKDAVPQSVSYKDQLRDVLDEDLEDDDEEREVEHSLLHDDEEPLPDPLIIVEQLPGVLSDGASSDAPPSSSISQTYSQTTLAPTTLPASITRPFLHPTISRLRSVTPSASGSHPSIGTLADVRASPSPSHFSALSPGSSSAHSPTAPSASGTERHNNTFTLGEREVFRWTSLPIIASHVFNKPSAKAAAVLGARGVGSPLVIAANGLICIGTDTGHVCVYDFKQTLKCVCGDQSAESTVGPVTALALSNDHTYVAVGHARGHVQLFDLARPEKPARFVPPTTFAAVASGRKEGHLVGSRIVSVGFVAGRHTAIVTADQHGIAFYHSLGKVLFVDATDVIRILGKYPDEELLLPQNSALNGATPQFRRRRTRRTNTLLGMAPLPLGTSPHPTDAYNVVALLTGAKLVIVGLKPSPKTWYRRHRTEEEGQAGKSRFRGTLAWYPAVLAGKSDSEPPPSKKGKVHPQSTTNPMLVYSWGATLNLVRVSETKVPQQVTNARTGKTSTVDVGRLTFEETARWSAQDDVLGLQWLNAKQIVVVTHSSLEVYDAHSQKLVEHVHFDATSLVSPTLGLTSSGAISYADSLGDIAHSLRTYKGKIFLLDRQDVRVGTLLTWADRILAYVQDGDFLSAIETTRTYYLGKAPGNKNGLPDDPDELRTVVGEKMRELMVASMRYAFSEDRMTDGTHFSADGRGVDRTALFEGLVATFARACITLDDFDLLWEDLFQEYDSAGITRIYLQQLEVFIFDNDIRYVPPRITQRLVAMHADDRRPDLAERAIWHLDPECLDINQSIRLCQEYHLYDALIHVYTSALKDYKSPIVDLLAFVRRVMRFRRESGRRAVSATEEREMEPVFFNAYKIFPYLTNVLSGLSYPGEEPLEENEAEHAKHDVYSFLFFGRSSVWPLGENGKLVLTADEEGGMEPTYPYTRLLLRFDAEAFLNALDIAFEDAYLNDERRSVSRLVVIKTVLEILNDPDELTPADQTFIRIFIARNVPKYPQYIEIAPSTLHALLVGLAKDSNPDTVEDRQLAAEYLLSAYTPHNAEQLLSLFEAAHFYRILRSWYKQEQKWPSLLLAYFHDAGLRPSDVFSSAKSIIDTSIKSNKGVVPLEILTTVTHSLPQLLNMSVRETADLIDAHTPDLHSQALAVLASDDSLRFAYLSHLVGPPSTDDEDPRSHRNPSSNVPSAMRELFVDLHCQFDPAGVIPALTHLPTDYVEQEVVLRVCEQRGVYDAVMWALNRAGNPGQALEKAEAYDTALAAQIAQKLADPKNYVKDNLEQRIDVVRSIGKMGIAICTEHTSVKGDSSQAEDMWFRLLRTQIESVQAAASCCPLSPAGAVSTDAAQAVSALRALVQETFSSLVSASSGRTISFPRLFTRLVDATSRSASGTPYTEFRTILTSMMDSYRFEGDMLVITKHLLDRDHFDNVSALARERKRGWAPSRGVCARCRRPATQGPEGEDKIIVYRSGALYHSGCADPELRA